MRTLIITLILLTFTATPLVFVSANNHDASWTKFNPITVLPIPAGLKGDGESNKNDESNWTIEQFVRVIYLLSISIAALLAVVRIIYGGVQYMLSDVVTNKQEAKKTIYGAILGLIIVLAAVFILQQINPRLTQFNLLENAPALAPAGTNPGTNNNSAVAPVAAPTATPGESSGREIQDTLDPNNCSNLVTTTGGGYCCNDNNTCADATTETSDLTEVIPGFDPNRIYETQEAVALLTAISDNPDVIDLGPGGNYTEEVKQQTCADAAAYRDRPGATAYTLQQNVARLGFQTVQERIICVMEPAS